MDFHCGSAGKEPAYNVGDLGLIPGLGRSPGEGRGYPLQYYGLENSMDCTVCGVPKSRKQLSDFHFTFTGGRVVGDQPAISGDMGSIPGAGRFHMLRGD